jgi:hypothetical protein
LFLRYALWRLVCEKVPVLYKVNPGSDPYILLDQQQAYIVETKDFGEDELHDSENKQMWILIDATAFPSGIPPEFLLDGGPLPMLVYSSSPQPFRWKATYNSNMSMRTIIMDPWSKWEAELLWVRFPAY